MRKLISVSNVSVSSSALLKGVIISPRKVNEVARVIRKRYVEDAKRMLFCMKRKASDMIYKLLNSAIANSKIENKSSLVIMELTVGRGPIMKRVIFCGRGRRGIERKRISNIKLVLGTVSLDLDKKINDKKEAKNGSKG